MSLPYENATSGERALGEIQKILRGFGCSKFGSMVDDAAQEILIQFEYRGRPVSVKASMRGYAAAWLKAHPHGPRVRVSKQVHERRALDVANTAVYSLLRDWIKGQVTAIECGILTFEGAFLGQILLPSGKTILDTVQTERLLPPPMQ